MVNKNRRAFLWTVDKEFVNPAAIIPIIIIGVSGYISTRLEQSMAELGFFGRVSKSLIHVQQMIMNLGPKEICITL